MDTPEASVRPSMPIADEEVSLLDYWRMIWRRRWLIASVFLACTVAAGVISLLQPKIYESTATLLPSLESKEGLGSLMALSQAAGAAQSLGISLPGTPATPTDLFVAMLKSRVMADAVIQRFDLLTYYGTKTMQETRKALEGDTTIRVTKEKVIQITVASKDPQLAADVANFYVSNLDHLNRTLNVSKASHNRAFIEKRLAETHTNLVRAEEALKEFQTHNKTVAVEAQSKAMIEAAATLQGQITAQEVQLQVMNTYLSPDNPEVARVRSSLEELRKQLYLLESGRGGKGMLPGDRLHPAMVTVPTLALEYGRLMRELKVQETLYTLLTSQLEQAKLQEARDTPTVQVLDPAVPAEKKSRPRVTLNVLLAGVLSLFVGIFLAFFLDYVDRLKGRVASEAIQP
ncbi:MAG TPA: Wzz/FepE/Etk N-terminal domain-containing protein [Nitrospiraceae bacterium]|jgi:uncharacterized protein involved in exopolysaccharide biosynthesis|nr:Wzz/FepE/Etk N-terminal domain-containing protein [Nitrospiraceae bacterium]